MKYNYYYNHKDGEEWRNNLIYTSLVNEDRTVFVQWFNNDTEYHKGKNTVNPELLEEKWNRELKYLQLMRAAYPQYVPTVLDIDYNHRKIYLSIDGDDFWQQSINENKTFTELLPNWDLQLLEINQAHKRLGLFKYSMHPSSYFIVNGELKSINYFFAYHKNEGPISIEAHQSHISTDRQKQMRGIVENMGISWTEPQDLLLLQDLCFESFSTNYPRDFIDRVKAVYHD